MQAGAHITRLALHVIRGEGLSEASSHAPDTQLFITVRTAYGRKIFQTRSHVVHSDAAPAWDLSCVVDLAQDAPMDSTVFIEVRKQLTLRVGKPRLLCSYFGCIDDLLRASMPYTSGRLSQQMPVRPPPPHSKFATSPPAAAART